ncbi:MAG TPA: type II toxin-antitoxin system prevent-host-death family antitoxin [Leptospiraceae bacterium]|nr:type II toxin-antitoxin system prevent-host-death family antitoxin [Leptospiraceae bacterium]HMW08022.1 type II toxin-antitoxin system prevent-host-death family antitoxin [Leptospiraceae bacterium]HMX34705.1 type II toxin-antitoxin system prevent-host-death family antitoxin [Leptospiraceae bacterium]HMY33758.1 type II toxin-antitoxin system prevent-host-death family antitoxin [Leptospiraceae bacterium]HMZ64870.1 type II toxin-antitoxin system prevent-host-death family antitoxin [Leptospirace
MILVGVRDLKAKLSHFIHQAKTGNEIIVTEHGKAVARLIKEPTGKNSLTEKLYRLAEKGTIELPTRNRTKKKFVSLKTKSKKSASDLLLESR